MEHGLAIAIRIAIRALRRSRGGTRRRARADGRFAVRLAAWLAMGFLSLAVFSGCSGCSSSPSSAACDPSRCPQGETCIDDGSGAAAVCRMSCTQHAQCPTGWYCNDGQPESWCVPSTLELTRGAGQWGTPCSASDGRDDNPACDAADNFLCFGVSPTDASAFCTYYDCEFDADCPGGWWCATIDDAPDVLTANRSFGAGSTRAVCLPRQYCAPCRVDHDCAPAQDGSQQHCVAGAAGAEAGSFCAPQCATSGDCPLDAACVLQWGVCADKRCTSDGDCQASGSSETCVGGVCALACAGDADCPPANAMPQHCATGPAGAICAPQACLSDDDCPPTLGTYQHCNAGACTPECASDTDCNPGAGDQTCVALSACLPRAGACKGDGTFCSPCRSDADCSAGYCLVSTYSKERFCSAALTGGARCSATTGPSAGGCPPATGDVNYAVIACTSASSDFAPADQCIGEVTFGTVMGQPQYEPGCWTRNR